MDVEKFFCYTSDMPTMWRYALHKFLSIFSLSVCTFILVLLVSRFKEIARFGALSANWLKTGLFIVYQVPSILPIAIPISALIASFLLFQRLSRTQELTAFRSGAFSLTSLFSPILLISFFLSLINFSICSEISPFCRRETKTLLYRETSENPLLLLQRQKLAKIKNTYLKMKIRDEGLSAKDLVLIAPNESNQRLSLLSAKNLKIEQDLLLGQDVAIISHLSSAEGFDPLIIENQASMSTEAPLLSAALKKNRPRLDANVLGLKMLRIRAIEPGKRGFSARGEIIRRISLSLSVFSFAFLGATFGIEQGRRPSRKGAFIAISFCLLLLISYLFGKEMKRHLWVSLSAFFLPHLLIWSASIFQLKQINQGIE
jgi:lipopolysaccharide export system permease protein